MRVAGAPNAPGAPCGTLALEAAVGPCEPAGLGPEGPAAMAPESSPLRLRGIVTGEAGAELVGPRPSTPAASAKPAATTAPAVTTAAAPPPASTEGARPEALLAHAHHGFEGLVTHAASSLGHPVEQVIIAVDPELCLQRIDELIEEPDQGLDLLVGQGVEVVGVLPTDLDGSAGLGQGNHHDAPVGLGRGALDEPVGLELLEQLVEGLLADVEEVGELASGDGALHLQGGEHPAASASGVGQGAGMGMGGDVTTTHEPMKAA